LNHKNIEVILDTDYKSILESVKFDKMIYTGPIDYFFDYKYGKLPYRSIRFEFKNFEKELLQESAVYNFTNKEVDYTRVTEYKHLTAQKSKSTTISYEFAEKNGEPFYSIPTEINKRLYQLYKSESYKLSNVNFCGRLTEYQYYNMDQVVANSFSILKRF
jgi:UDP-galactopyranose mutase